VEGVARGLDPHINIWEVAKPIVEGYIAKSIGPRALLRDLAQTARVLGRFGPRLPRLVEAALIAQAEHPPALPEPRPNRALPWLLSLLSLALGIWIGSAL
jgi:ubiquinone biosynthesis protein